MNTYEECLRLYMSGATIPPSLREALAKVAAEDSSRVVREQARVLGLCISGDVNRDGHTRNLARKRTLNLIRKKVVKAV